MMIALSLALLSSAQADPLEANLLYFVLVDRFNNGNPANDEDVDVTDIQAFHGGDIEGVSSRLEHIKALGADALWLSPIFEMRTEKFGGHGAFHGYWVQHLDGIESRFGGEDALRTLQQQLEQDEIPLVLDMVYNHVSFDSPMRSAHPDWFHRTPSISNWNDPVQLTTHQVHGLPDLNQDRAPVYSYLLHRSLHWAKYSHGYRIDAIRHLESSFIKEIGADIKKEHSTDFWLLGEDFQGNPAALRQRALETGLDALFDFPLYYALTGTFCDHKTPMELASILWLDQYYPESLQLVRFLDNHDLPRIITRCGGSKQQTTQALFFLLSVRGLPMLSYGTELGLTGGDEPENRRDMPWERLGGVEDNTKTIRSMIDLRKNYPVLASGTGWIERIDDGHLEYHQQNEQHRSIYLYNSGSEAIATPRYPHPPLVAMAATESITILPTEQLPDMLKPNEALLLIYPAEPVEQSRVAVEITVAGQASDQYLLVGSDPLFGDWNPDAGLAMTHFSDGQWSIRPTLPENSVICYKLVRKIAEELKWAPGENRCLFPKSTKLQQLPSID